MKDFDGSYDVVVAGAGPAGSIAALQAARAGAKTLLVEKSSMPGGTTTIAGLSFPGLFHAWGRQVIGGIGWELVSKAVSEGGGTLPDFSRQDLPHWALQVRVDPSLYACLLDEEFAKAGVDVLYHCMPLEVRELSSHVEIRLAAKEGALKADCSVAIDATGDADLVGMAGFKLISGAERQPATPIIRLGGYRIEDVDLDAVEAACKAEVAAGRMSHLDTTSRSMAWLLRGYGENCIHVPSPDASSSRGKSELEMRGRAAVLRVYRFLKRFKGLENLRIDYMAPQCGVRETSVIDGELTISVEDYTTGRRWEDSLCNAFYPIDLHVEEDGGLKGWPLERGVVPTVPARALVPKGSKRMLAAGRCVSSDRLANSALRVQASCMAMGQVAGALAALSAKRRLAPLNLDLAEVKALLLAHGAILPA